MLPSISRENFAREFSWDDNFLRNVSMETLIGISRCNEKVFLSNDKWKLFECYRYTSPHTRKSKLETRRPELEYSKKVKSKKEDIIYRRFYRNTNSIVALIDLTPEYSIVCWCSQCLPSLPHNRFLYARPIAIADSRL